MSTQQRPAGPALGRGPAQQGNANGVSSLGSITKAQRAAVIIAVLGEAAARPIVEKLDDATLAQVAAELENVSFLAREELAEIVVDFLQHLRHTSGAFRGGKERARAIIVNVLDEARLGKVFGDGGQVTRPVSRDKDDTWAQLEQRSPEQIAAYVSRLTPNIISLILRKLDVSVASEIVSNISEDKLDPVIGYLVESERPDPEIDSVIARMVQIEFLNNAEAAAGEDNAHLETVGELLSLIPADRRDRLIAFLNTSHQGKMESIEKVIFTIDGLPDMLPRNAVPVVFRELGEDTMKTLLTSLQGSSSAVADYLLGNISSRLADQYRDGLSGATPVSLEQAEILQRDFLKALMNMKRRGQIVMEKPASV